MVNKMEVLPYNQTNALNIRLLKNIDLYNLDNFAYIICGI